MTRTAPCLQDYPYFPYKNHSMCAVFLHMDDTTPENGGLCVYPGSHKLGPLPAQKTVANGLSYYWCDPKQFPIDGATPITAKKGEVVIFSYLLLHGSYLNLSDRVRRMFLVQVRHNLAGFAVNINDTRKHLSLFHFEPCVGYGCQ